MASVTCHTTVRPYCAYCLKVFIAAIHCSAVLVISWCRRGTKPVWSSTVPVTIDSCVDDPSYADCMTFRLGCLSAVAPGQMEVFLSRRMHLLMEVMREGYPAVAMEL